MIMFSMACSASQRFRSVSDSRASNTAAPTSRYVNVHTMSEIVRTFCFFMLHAAPLTNEIPTRGAEWIWGALSKRAAALHWSDFAAMIWKNCLESLQISEKN